MYSGLVEGGYPLKKILIMVLFQHWIVVIGHTWSNLLLSRPKNENTTVVCLLTSWSFSAGVFSGENPMIASCVRICYAVHSAFENRI